MNSFVPEGPVIRRVTGPIPDRPLAQTSGTDSTLALPLSIRLRVQSLSCHRGFGAGNRQRLPQS